MKTLIFFLILFCSVSNFALEIETVWTETSEKRLAISCGEDEACVQFCMGNNSCFMREKVCKNCVGTSLKMTYIFEEMGRNLFNSGEAVGPYELFDLLTSTNFVSLSSKSVYNLIERFDSLSLRRRFRSLCLDETAYPIVFFNKVRSGEIGSVKAVWCNSGVYRMDQDSEVIIEDSLF